MDRRGFERKATASSENGIRGRQCGEVGGALLVPSLLEGGAAVEREACDAEQRDQRYGEDHEDLTVLTAASGPPKTISVR